MWDLLLYSCANGHLCLDITSESKSVITCSLASGQLCLWCIRPGSVEPPLSTVQTAWNCFILRPLFYFSLTALSPHYYLFLLSHFCFSSDALFPHNRFYLLKKKVSGDDLLLFIHLNGWNSDSATRGMEHLAVFCMCTAPSTTGSWSVTGTSRLYCNTYHCYQQ